MKNHITISMAFFFKGRKLTPSLVVDLDELVKNNAGLESLYPRLAKNNAIDLYSYEYEIMLVEELTFSDAVGLAADYLVEGKFDLAAFEQALRDENIVDALSKIASDNFSIDDLSTEPDLKSALLAAYKLGQQSALDQK